MTDMEYWMLVGSVLLLLWAVAAQVAQWWKQWQDWRWERRNRK